MRIFVILGHTGATTPSFTLNDLPGSAGRMDILCRCVTASFCLSHGIRRDVAVYLILQDRVAVRFEGERLKHLNPDERSTGALIQKALEVLQKTSPDDELSEQPSTPGIFVARRGLASVLSEIHRCTDQLIWLHEGGSDLRAENLSDSIALVLSDHLDFTPEEEALLAKLDKLSVGPKVLHADHCITIVHNELDRRQPE